MNVLGGRVIHKSRNEILKTDSTYVAVADAICELAILTIEGSYAMEDWKRNKLVDTYHALTWEVSGSEEGGGATEG